MVEWLILVILVPAVVVPVVLLAGFAGCHIFFGVETLPPLPPFPGITKAEGTSVSTVALTVYYSRDVLGFEFERKQQPEGTLYTLSVFAIMPDLFTKVDATTYRIVDGEELLAAKNYLYRVRAINTDGEYSEWSAAAPNVPAMTGDYRTTFEWTPDEKMASRDATGWAAFSLVQRIEAGRLTASGDNIRVTLRASSAGSASIERVYVSRLATGAGSDAYDSADDLTPVSVTPIVIPRNESVALAAKYHLDEAQTLLVIVDFGAAPTDIRATDVSLATDTVNYQKEAAGDQAQLPDRAGFIEVPEIRLLEKIEVG